MSRQREVVEGIQVQGEDEEIVYSLDTTKWADSPTNVVVEVKDSGGNDVTDEMTTGDPSSPRPGVVLLPTIHSVTAGEEYRVEVRFSASGQVLETWFTILGEE